MMKTLTIKDIGNIDKKDVYEYIENESISGKNLDFQPTNWGTNPTEVVMLCTLPVFFEDIEEDGEIAVAFLVKEDEEYDDQNIYQKDRIEYIKALEE
jgi:hypothetical protein